MTTLPVPTCLKVMIICLQCLFVSVISCNRYSSFIVFKKTEINVNYLPLFDFENNLILLQLTPLCDCQVLGVRFEPGSVLVFATLRFDNAETFSATDMHSRLVNEANSLLPGYTVIDSSISLNPANDGKYKTICLKHLNIFNTFCYQTFRPTQLFRYVVYRFSKSMYHKKH